MCPYGPNLLIPTGLDLCMNALSCWIRWRLRSIAELCHRIGMVAGNGRGRLGGQVGDWYLIRNPRCKPFETGAGVRSRRPACPWNV